MNYSADDLEQADWGFNPEVIRRYRIACDEREANRADAERIATALRRILSLGSAYVGTIAEAEARQALFLHDTA